MKIIFILISTSLLASSPNWKKHRSCISSAKEIRGHCKLIKFNNDQRISKNIKSTTSKICKVSRFKYDFHFNLDSKNITIPDVDIRKFLHRDFDKIKEISLPSCSRKLNMHFGEFNRKAKTFYPCSYKENSFSEVHIINNCREPGNYEFKFFNNKKLSYKGHTLFPKEYYEKILKEYTASYGRELNIEDSQIGYTKAKFFQTSSERAQGHDYLSTPAPNFHMLQEQQRCSVKDLKPLYSSSRPIGHGKINVFAGQIPYNEFDDEVKVKSGYLKQSEPLSYIRTPCKKDDNYQEQQNLAPPKGIAKHSHYSTDQATWDNSKCEYIPYSFREYNQLLKYNSAFSAFEVDGIYSGLKKNGGSNSNRKGTRLAASLFHLKNLSNYELHKTSKGLRNIKLINQVEGVSLFIGNIDLNKISREGTSFLMGIDAQKLVSKYNLEIFKTKNPLFTFAYDNRSQIILNQHDLSKVGFEKIWIKKRGRWLVIDLISHERITPVWRGSIKLSK